MCSSFFGSLTLLNIEMGDQLGVSVGKKSVKFPGMSVLPVTLSIALDVSDGRHHIVEL